MTQPIAVLNQAGIRLLARSSWISL